MSLPNPTRRFSLLEPTIAAFVGLILVSNIIAQKFFEIHLFGIAIPSDVGTILIFPMTYIFSDILTEVYGYAVSRRVIWYGFAMNILAALVFKLAIIMPFSPYFTGQAAYASILGAVPDLVIASLAGYWLGSFTNDSILAAMKVWMIKWDPKQRWIALRTIVSTVCGELIDTIFFVGIATVLGVFPAEILVMMILSQWIVKSLYEIVLTPITIIVIRAMKRYEATDIVGTDTWNPFAFTKGGGVNLLDPPK